MTTDATGSLAPSRASDKESAAGKMSATAYVAMRRNILDNVWTVGFQATEIEISEMLGMSRTPVREALMRLQQEGLIKVTPRHGMRVLPVSPDDMKQIYQILTSLESTAAELVAARGLSAEEMKPLKRASEAMDEALAADDLDAWARADERFHTHLLDLCGNEMLRSVVLNFWDRAHRARMVTLRIRPKPVNSTKEHSALVSAIRKGDVAKAGAVQRAHRERAGEELLGLLTRLGLSAL